ncbi:MAG: YciI family protein [Actinomycetes bacterium]
MPQTLFQIQLMAIKFMTRWNLMVHGETESSMKKFVFLYNSNPNEVPIDDVMDVWMVWFNKIMESIVEMGNPFTDGMLVASGRASTIPEDRNPISGYTVIKAKDMDEAIAIAKTCPGQSGLQVYEAVEM